MATRTIRLTFRGPVHFGRGRLSDSDCTFSAATVFSALFIEAVRAGVNGELFEAVRCGEFAISDAFPFIARTMYLPKPMVSPNIFDNRNKMREASGMKIDSRERKANKKLSFIPADRYGDYLAGSFDAITELAQFNLGESSLHTKVNLTRSDSDDAKPYFVGSFSFAPNAGLYFITRGSYDSLPLLELLSYAGLGGKRSSGYGRFEFSVEDSSPLPSSTSHTGISVLLATATPRQDELSGDLLKGARYRLVRKGGFVQSQTHATTPQKKRDLYLFASGSTFTQTFEGDVFDVNATPDAHPVFRYAKAMWMEV
jgi:CRISPR-associated protein Csm4